MSGPRDEGEDVARPNEVLQLAANNAFQPGIGNLLDLRFEAASFDAVYARNCLIHVPNAELDGALAGIARVLRPEGLFYLSVYGGGEFEGIWDGDSWEEKRFFSFRTDDALREAVTGFFELHSFEIIPQGFGGYHYQSLVLRKPATAHA